MDNTAEKVKQLHSVNKRRKKLEAEEKELKQWFKENSDGDDAIFVGLKHNVLVSWKERAGWNGTKLMKHLGGKADQFRSITKYQDVAIRNK